MNTDPERDKNFSQIAKAVDEKKQYFTFQDVKNNLVTKWFDLEFHLLLDHYWLKNIENEAKKLKSITSHGCQSISRKVDGLTYQCQVYQITYDKSAESYQDDNQTTNRILIHGKHLEEIKKFSQEGYPLPDPNFGLEFVVHGSNFDQHFDKLASLVMNEFKNSAEFFDEDKSIILFTGKVVKFRTRVKKLLQRPTGAFHFKFDSGDGCEISLKVIAKCYGVAPKEDDNQLVRYKQERVCWLCKSPQHKKKDCPKFWINIQKEKDSSKSKEGIPQPRKKET